jgi:site-specific recombinase XerD
MTDLAAVDSEAVAGVVAAAVPFNLPEAISPDSDPYAVYLGRLTGESARAMRGCLDRLARLAVGTGLDDLTVTGYGFPWQHLRYAHTARLLAVLQSQDWSPAYINKHLVALRQVLREAWRLGLMTAEDQSRASDLPAVAGSRLAAGRMLTPQETAALLDACTGDGSSKGGRDAALLAVAYSAGVRRAEIVGLNVDDWHPADRSLRVIGKGNRERRVYLAPWAARYLQGWLRLRGRRATGPLFVRVYKSGKIGTDRLSGQTVADILDERAAQAGTPAASPHDLRRTFISTLLADPQTDLVTVQALAGHASAATTARYDRRADVVRQAAASRLPDPHRASR